MSGSVCSPFENITATYYPNFGVDIDKTKKAIERYPVCGKDYYIKRHTDNCLVGCTPCNEDDRINDNSEMCSDIEEIWTQAQLDANISGTPNNRWTDMKTVLMVDSNSVESGELNSIKDTVKEWYINRMDDTELRSIMQNMKWGEDIDEGIRLQAFKTAISSGRGTTIPCYEPDDNKNVNFNGLEDPINLGSDWDATESIGPIEKGHKRWEGCDNSFSSLHPGMPPTFGPKNITQSEFLEWSMEYDREMGTNNSTQLAIGDGNTSNETIYGDMTKGIMGMELFPPNREFEDCINELLNEYDDYGDSKIISEIRDINNILQLESRHIQFIKKKLELLIISSSKVKVKQCMLDNLVLEDICKMSLSYKMLVVLNILFSTIGFNLELSKVNSDDPNIRKKLITIIDEMGDLIPRSLDKIIEISEEIEYDNCGKVSGRTVLLKELQTVVFNPSKKNINLELPNIKNFLSEEYMSDNEFNRFAMIAGIGLAVLKFI